MRCFIHLNEEAIAVCKKCGKAMCATCSAYSGHSGICPECRREEFIQERAKLQAELENSQIIFQSISVGLFIFLTALAGAGTLLFVILGAVMIGVLYLLAIGCAIGAICAGVGIINSKIKKQELTVKINELNLEIERLTKEIDKLTNALSIGVGTEL